MKHLEKTLEENVDLFIGNLQKLVGQAAIESIEQRLVHRSRKRASPQGPIKPRRSRAQIESLAEALYAEICKQPGAKMRILSKALDQSSEDLALPARLLAKAGKVKKTGRNQQTRYFPLGLPPAGPTHRRGRPPGRSRSAK